MPRKSRELRLSQTRELIELYAAAGLLQHRNARFASDMGGRLNLGRGLSPKQRKWLDSIIEEGIPTAKDQTLYDRIVEARDTDGMQGQQQILNDFANKAFNGWALSEKQQAWLDKMLTEADHFRANGPWRPTPDIIERLRLACQLARGYSSTYWGTHGGSRKAFETVTSWLTGEDDVVAGVRERNPHVIDDWCCTKLLKAMARPLRELDNPKFSPGEMYWMFIQKTYPEKGGDYVPALVSVGPYISERGKVVYSALVGGELIETDRITKRRTR